MLFYFESEKIVLPPKDPNISKNKVNNTLSVGFSKVQTHFEQIANNLFWKQARGVKQTESKSINPKYI